MSPRNGLNCSQRAEILYCLATIFVHKEEAKISPRITRAVKPLSSVSRLLLHVLLWGPCGRSERGLCCMKRISQTRSLHVCQKTTGFRGGAKHGGSCQAYVTSNMGCGIKKLIEPCHRWKTREQSNKREVV